MDANLGCHCPVMHLRAGLSLVVLGQFQEHIKLIRNSDDIRRFWNLEGPSCGLSPCSEHNISLLDLYVHYICFINASISITKAIKNQ